MQPMKKTIIIILLLLASALLLAQNKVEQIAVSYDNPVVTRVAITPSQKTTWSYSVDKDKHTVTVKVTDCDVSSPLIGGLSNSKLVTDIDLLNKYNAGEIILGLSGPFFIETMTVDKPFKIVLDLFVYKKVYSYQELLYQANFYEKSGFYAKAAKQYAQMLRDYPQNKDTNYYWGNLLLKQGKNESAIAKLQAVPQTSKFYQAAQKSLTKLNAASDEVPIPVDNTPIPIDTAVVDTTRFVAPVKPLNIVDKSQKFSIFSFKTLFGVNWDEFVSSKFMLQLFALPIWFWLIILVVLIIIVLVIFDVMHFRKTRKKKSKPGRKVKQGDLDPEKLDLVAKLLQKNWQEPEIARELLLTAKEAHKYIKQARKASTGKTKPVETEA